jgi:hypothetical protein
MASTNISLPAESGGGAADLTAADLPMLPDSQVAVTSNKSSAFWGAPIDGFVFDSTAIQTLGNANGYGFIATSDRSNGASAGLYFLTGDASVSGNAGAMFFQCGTSAAGAGGVIQLQAGNGATTGGAIELKTGMGATVKGNLVIEAAKIDASASTNALRLPNLAADPGTPADGDLWYNSTDDELKIRINGATLVVATV